MEYMDLLPPLTPASFSRARLARPIASTDVGVTATSSLHYDRGRNME